MQEKHKYKGYTAVKCSQASWRDENNSKRPMGYYKLELITPYGLEMNEEDLLKRLRCDLGEVFGEIWNDNLTNTNRRALKMLPSTDVEKPAEYEYNCFGSNFRQNFQKERWEVTLYLHDPFSGFETTECATECENAE